MCRDLWFMRGWTLQELLAPKKIKFYLNTWCPLTNEYKYKTQELPLWELITEITQIPVDQLLKKFDPGTNDIREKLVWASHWKTTVRVTSELNLEGKTSVYIYGIY
jgi:hypothetical protein